jgi:hypothetical protein
MKDFIISKQAKFDYLLYVPKLIVNFKIRGDVYSLNYHNISDEYHSPDVIAALYLRYSRLHKTNQIQIHKQQKRTDGRTNRMTGTGRRDV